MMHSLTNGARQALTVRKQGVSGMKAKVLIVEDEAPLAEMLRYNLEAEGFRVSHAETGEEAEIIVTEERPDIVVLDWMLPTVSGIELCRRLRARPDTRSIPILMVTARGEESDRIRGLSTGADDYVVKPFSLPELMARVKAILRRAAPNRVSDVLTVGDIELDRAAHKVMRGVREVRLGPTEFRLLEFLMENSARVLSRSQLLDGVWGRDAFVDERTVDVHVGRLRKALIRGKERDPIRTVRGAGYVFGERSSD
jgi:two-component system phosphate regulon response regulator PhoB